MSKPPFVPDAETLRWAIRVHRQSLRVLKRMIEEEKLATNRRAIKEYIEATQSSINYLQREAWDARRAFKQWKKALLGAKS